MTSSRFIFISVIFISSLSLSAQNNFRQVISLGGGFDANENGLFSYTIGQPAVSTLYGDGIILTQGFQQPDRLRTDYVNDVIVFTTLKVFPNPAVDLIKIHLSSDHTEGAQLMFHDALGQLVECQSIESLRSYKGLVKTKQYKPGIYFLSVSSHIGETLFSKKIIIQH